MNECELQDILHIAILDANASSGNPEVTVNLYHVSVVVLPTHCIVTERLLVSPFSVVLNADSCAAAAAHTARRQSGRMATLLRSVLMALPYVDAARRSGRLVEADAKVGK